MEEFGVTVTYDLREAISGADAIMLLAHST